MREDPFLVFSWLYQIGHKNNGVEKIWVYFLSYEKYFCREVIYGCHSHQRLGLSPPFSYPISRNLDLILMVQDDC